ncbi:TPA: hypothetical protein PC505_003933 [Morganella morganii]|nr:hypothetical protein [Morganella morganii]HDF2424478.1 hypothetical protein [Morganella morganii]
MIDALTFYTLLFLCLWLAAGATYFLICKPHKKGNITSFVITLLMGVFACLISYLLLKD